MECFAAVADKSTLHDSCREDIEDEVKIALHHLKGGVDDNEECAVQYDDVTESDALLCALEDL